MHIILRKNNTFISFLKSHTCDPAGYYITSQTLENRLDAATLSATSALSFGWCLCFITATSDSPRPFTKA